VAFVCCNGLLGSYQPQSPANRRTSGHITWAQFPKEEAGYLVRTPLDIRHDRFGESSIWALDFDRLTLERIVGNVI